MDPEKSNHITFRTMREYLQLIVECIIREEPESNQIYQLIVSATKHCPIDRETLTLAQPYNLLVICDQNQGRSQIEEAILKHLAQMIGIPLNLRSAGVNATPEKYGGKPGPMIVRKLNELGIAISDATVDQLEENDIDDSTIVLALCAIEHIPDHAFRAKVVIAAEMVDNFPGSKAPNNTESLDSIMDEAAWLGLNVVTKLAEAIEQSDFAIFTKEFERLILTSPME